MASSIIASLGYGSGLDTTSLVSQLTAANKAPKDKQLTARATANSASVSALASVSNGIDAFATSLKTLISGGTLTTQPTASDETLVGVRALSGARLGDLSAQLEVRQLAQAQTVSSAAAAAKTSSVGKGVLTLSVGGTSTAITIDDGNDTVAGVAAAINGARTGVIASVVSDAGGVRLVLKGESGAAKAFTLSAAPAAYDTDAGGAPIVPAMTLDSLAYDPGQFGGMTRAQAAQDAIVRLDGVELTRAVNSVSDLIPGVAVDLKKAAVGTTIAIGSVRPAEAITAAITDFVGAYNEMKTLIDGATRAAGTDGTAAGALRGDLGMREMQRRLGRLTSTRLVEGGTGPKTLAELGVVTNRDGTLSANAATLAATLAADPDGVEALFNPTQRSSSPFVAITSLAGATPAGSYTLTDLVPQSDTTPASGKLDGVAMVGTENSLSASSASAARGLIVQASASVASAVVTIDLGLGGALQSIRDALRATAGPLASTSSRLSKEGGLIARDRTSLESRSAAYEKRLTTQFTAMDKRVTAFRATQSYIEQQVAVWTKGD